MNIYEKILKLSEEIAALQKENEKNLPYNINIIDELRANENAHSRIFGKILKYKVNDRHLFLESFLSRMGIECEVINPVITVEKDRIDCLIRDDNYAVIIENKVHNAVDQKNQIDRYFKTMRDNYNHDPDNIYIIYLTRSGEKEVSELSLSSGLREILGDRFIKCNFREHILQWLEFDAIPNCQYKDTTLISAIQQYIDHLKGLFYLRESQKDMQDDIKKFLKEKFSFGFDKENGEFYNALENTKKLLMQLDNLKIEQRDHLRRRVLEAVHSAIGKSKWQPVVAVNKEVDFDNSVNDANFGFKCIESDAVLKYESKEYRLSFEIQSWKRIICGVFINNDNKAKDFFINEFKKQFEEQNKKPDKELNLNVISNNFWVYLNPADQYNIYGNEIGLVFYDDRFNSIFIEKHEEIASAIVEKIGMMKEAWNVICEKKIRFSK